MSGKFGLYVVALAAAALVLCESESFAGRRHGGRGCSSCGSACATCTASADTAAVAPEAPASAPVASSAPVANPGDAQVSSTEGAVNPSTRSTSYVSRRSARRSRR